MSDSYYLAGPMRGLPNNNFDTFHAVERAARAWWPDAVIINPARLDEQAGFDGSHTADGGFMREAMRRDLSAICGCTHLVLLPGWEDSEGATTEYQLAMTLGLADLYAVLDTSPEVGGGAWVFQGTAPSPAPTPRKHIPVASGVLDYFPDAIRAVAHCSWVGNEQHNSGEPLHWSRDKSNDHADCMMRHFMERGTVDEDGVLHATKMAWRALALLQLEIEEARDG